MTKEETVGKRMREDMSWGFLCMRFLFFCFLVPLSFFGLHGFIKWRRGFLGGKIVRVGGKEM